MLIENLAPILIIIIGVIALIFLVLDKYPIETVSICLLSALIIAYLILPDNNIPSLKELLSGFSNPGLITVLSLLVMAEGLVAAGVINYLANLFETEKSYHPTILLSVILIVVALLSSVMNNTPIVVMFIPLIAALSERHGIDTRKTFLPLSYISMLGGMTTLMGSSTNLIGAGISIDYGIQQIGMLDISIPALIIALPCIVFVMYIMPLILPKQKSYKSLFSRDARQFLAEIEIEPNSKLLGVNLKENSIKELANSNILFVQRGEHAFYPPLEKLSLRVGDIIVLAATRKSLERAMQELGDQIHPHLTKEPGDKLEDAGEYLSKDARVLAEVLIAPRSEMIGKDLEQIRFRNFTSCIVLGLLRRSRMLKDRITEIPLLAGDVLLVQGSEIGISNLKQNSDVVLIDWSKKYLPQKSKLLGAIIIFLVTIFSAATGLVELTTASIIGATSMVAFKILSINRASTAIDRRIFITIACMLAYGSALQSSGAAQLIVQNLLVLIEGQSNSFILCALFILITLFTNLLTNNAAVIVFMPISINLAYALNLDPFPFIITVILAANMSFLTPFGYQTNLLVMAPGQYKFLDYIKCGVPLTLLSWIIFILFIPKYFNLN
ncbi:MAG: SLC13 family permease [Rickettsiales bacterium]|nr:SLC13 family permease [Rickettsiales bacterium]